jgi:hypothetical protein
VLDDAIYGGAQQFTSGTVTAQKIFTDGNGNVYTAGYFSGTVDFDFGQSTMNLVGERQDIFISKQDGNGIFLWAKQLSGRLSFATGISVDNSGNVYTTGYFQGKIDIDPGIATTNLTSTGDDDIFVSKLDSNGNFIWGKQLGGTGTDQSSGISVDGMGNVYTTGRFQGKADFDPGANTFYLTSVTEGSDIFVSKLDSSGNFAWVKQFGGTGFDIASDIGVDNSGNIYTTGVFEGNVDFDPGVGIANLTGTIDRNLNAFISKLDGDGNFIWAKQFSGNGGTQAFALSLDSIGNVYTTGYFALTTDFDPGDGIANLTYKGDFSDVFINKLDVDGNFIWVKQLGDDDLDRISDINVDSLGNVYTTGRFYETVDFDPSSNIFNMSSGKRSSNIFLSKLDNNGNFVWAKQFGDGDGENYNYIYANGMSVDVRGTIYIAGSFKQTADFDPGKSAVNFSAGGVSNSFINKLSSDGNYIATQQLKSGSVTINKILTDNAGNVYTMGGFQGVVDFNAGSIINNLISVGDEDDIFISKLDSSGNFVWARHFGGNSVIQAIDFSIDSVGNIYITGQFQSTADFDPSFKSANLTSLGGNDVFISKLDGDGNFVWAKQFGGNEFDVASGIEVDHSGNIYTVGSFKSTVDFDPGTSIVNLTTIGYSNLFISKLDSNGIFIWAKQLASGGFAEAADIGVDSTGNIYTTGTFSGTPDFDPSNNIASLTWEKEGRIFVSKLDSRGDFIWVKQFGGNGFDSVNGMSIDSHGNIYTTGIFYGTADFDPGVNTFDLVSSGSTDVFINKLDRNGQFVWAKRLGGDGFDQANDISVDSMGDVYTTGYFFRTADFDPSKIVVNLTNESVYPEVHPDVFISKLNSSGNFIWAKQLGGDGYEQASSISIDGAGNVYTVGIFYGKADFDPSADKSYLLAGGQPNSFISKLTQQISQTDLLLRNSASGEVRILGLNSNQVALSESVQLANGTIVRPGNDWKLVSSKADFNGDRIHDFVWFNSTTSESAIWYMQQGTTGLSNIIGSNSTFVYIPDSQTALKVGQGWQLVAVEDLLGDDRPEFLWEDRITGESAIWQLNIASNGRADINLSTSAFITFNNVAIQTGGSSSGWKITGVGNFDDDTSTKDLLWFNEKTSEMAVWQLNGTAVTGYGLLNYQGNTIRPAGWKPVAIGNIDGIGPDEIVLQNGNSVALWNLGYNFAITDKSTILTKNLTNGEQVQALADLNMDRSLDLLVRQRENGRNIIQIYNTEAPSLQLFGPTSPGYLVYPKTEIPYELEDLYWDVLDSADFGGPLVRAARI